MDGEFRPNVLFILADDLGWGDVGYHGSINRTPSIDRLASFGVELDQHYVAPVCTPTRVSLLTGRYPGRFGTHATVPSNRPILPDKYPTLASSLKEAGYDTGLFGKWHLGSDPRFCPNEYGFDTSYGSLAGGVDPYNHRYKRGHYSHTWHRDGERIEERGHVTDLIVREACRWIDGREGPWFCYVPFTAVHVPVDAPASWLNEYEYDRYSKDKSMDRSWKRYAAYASHMDSGVGRLIDTLKQNSQFERTIIIFCGDNGAAGTNYYNGEVDRYPGWAWETPGLGNNSPLRGEKGQLYEGGVRTPTLVAWPGHLEPRRCDYPLSITDWMPTLTRLALGEPQDDPNWDGINILPLLEGDVVELEDRSLYWNLKDERFALRRGDWKMVAKKGLVPEACELYNLRADPYETIDVADRRPELVEELLDEVAREHEKDGDSARPDFDQWPPR